MTRALLALTLTLAGCAASGQLAVVVPPLPVSAVTAAGGDAWIGPSSEVDTLSLAAGNRSAEPWTPLSSGSEGRITVGSDNAVIVQNDVTAASPQGITSLTARQRGYPAPCYADSEYAGYAQPGTATVRVRLLDVIDSTVVSPQVILCPATSCGIEVLAREFSVIPPCQIDSAYGSWLRYATAAWIPSADDADGTTPGDTSRAAVFSGVPSGLWIAVTDRSRLGGWTDESNPNTGHSWGTPARRVRLMGLIDVAAGVDTTVVLSWRWTAPDIGNPCIRYVVGVSGDTTWRPPAECR